MGLSVMGNFVLIPAEEHDALLAFVSGKSTFQPQTFVRVHRRKLYKGDLALVMNVSTATDQITLLVVPRISLEPLKKRSHRPPAALFHPSVVAAVYGTEAVTETDQQSFRFNKRQFVHGLESLKILASHVVQAEHHPLLEELHPFYSSALTRPQATRCIGGAVKRRWRVGERLVVVDGQLQGLLCRAVDIDVTRELATVVEIRTEDDDKAGVETQVPFTSLERHFVVGDNVRVVAGDANGRRGMVLKVDSNDNEGLTVLEDKTRIEVTIFVILSSD
jgi:transcription elongation factor